MKLESILSLDRIQYSSKIGSRKNALEHISKLLCQHLPGIESEDIFESYVERERLGSTAIGHGVAIPHIRSNKVREPVAAFLHLEKGIEFGAQDEEAVDLIFGLLVPEDGAEEHLEILAKLARMFSQAECRESFRQKKDPKALYQSALIHYENGKN